MFAPLLVDFFIALALIFASEVAALQCPRRERECVRNTYCIGVGRGHVLCAFFLATIAPPGPGYVLCMSRHLQ
jgi:hypothetical protein